MDRHTEEGRHDMPASAAPVSDTDLVQVSARMPRDLRRRIKMAATRQDISVQQAIQDALEEYLRTRDM